jgi:hypothetical protein
MDDMAASQQLLEEGARATAVGEDEGRSEPTREEGAKGGKAATKRQAHASPVELPTSQVPASIQRPRSPPRSFALDDINAYITSASPSHRVEVPDSQIELPQTTAQGLMSPPMTSSFAVPTSTAKKSKKMYKKSRRSIPAEPKHTSASDEHDASNAQADTAEGAAEPLSPSPSRTKRKRKRSNTGATSHQAESDASENDTIAVERPNKSKAANLEAKAPMERPRKRRSLLARKSAEFDPIEDEDIDGPSQRAAKTKPSASGELFSSQDNVPTPQREVLNTPNDHSTAGKGGSIKALVTPTKSKSGSHKQKRTNSRIDDQSPPDANAQQQSSGDDEITHAAPLEEGASTKKSRKKRKVESSNASEPRCRFSRKSNVDMSMSAAERALNAVRELHQPIEKRSKGDFTDDEEELIRRAIRDYQERHGLETNELVEIIQWTSDVRDGQFARQRSDLTTQELQDERESNAFWAELKQIELTRSLHRLKTHVRARYHTFKTGGWTEEEDEQLKSLMRLHPQRWKLISLIMGDRSYLDIFNRWKDYVQHGDSRHTNRWSKEEEEALLNAITTVTQRDEDHRAQLGKPELNYANVDINWPQVCIEMGNIRSRIQCTVKWTRMTKRDPPATIPLVRRPRATPEPDQIVDATPKTGPKSEPTPKKRRQRSKRDPAPSGEAKARKSPTKKRRRIEKPEPEPKVVSDDEDEDVPASTQKHNLSAQSEPEVVADTKGEASSAKLPKKPSSSVESKQDMVGDDEDESTAAEPEHDVDRDLEIEASTAELPETCRASEESEPELVADDEDDAQSAESLVERSPSVEQNAADVEGELDTVTQQVIPATPLDTQLRPVARPRTSGVSQMRWGDKFDLVEGVALLQPQNEEDINWYELSATMKQSWSIRTLQTALKELLDLVVDQGSFTDTIFELLQYLDEHYTTAELKEHYDPYQDLAFDEDAEAVEQAEENEHPKLVRQEDDIEAANLPNTKRKRRVSTHDSVSQQYNASTKRTKTTSTGSTPKQTKSAALVTESDDAESEAEL